jgi:anti-anti-sigma factor
MTSHLEVRKETRGKALCLHVRGRLDSYWADHLATALDEIIRAGAYRVLLDLGDVTFLSSAGIRVLLVSSKQLRTLRGSLAVCRASEQVHSVLTLSGLNDLLLLEEGPTVAGRFATTTGHARRYLTGVHFDVFELAEGGALSCEVLGNPVPLSTGGCRTEDCRTVRFPPASLGLGLGALGVDFDDCRGRFGEFLSAAGAAVYLPTDGSNVPDYLVGSETEGPELQVCYGLACRGAPGLLGHFEEPDEGGIGLAQLADCCLKLADAPRAGVALVAETAGLVGAALRRSPAAAGGADPLAFPEVRNWLTFTAERAYPHSTALVVGVVGSGDPGELAPVVRPLGPSADLWGHLHAAAFSFRPLARGAIDLRATLAALFEGQTLLGVLHLLYDDRGISGAGESEFVRGACWVGPLSAPDAERGAP